MEMIIHLGYNKTGTSTIQSYCHRNFEILKEEGLYYPKTGIYDHAHYGITKFFLNQPNSENILIKEDFLEQLKSEILDSSCNKILLSSEYFILANPTQIKNFREFLLHEIKPESIKLIVYLRRHDTWFESLFNQAVKTMDSYPFKLDIRDYILYALSWPACNYYKVLTKWANIFGDESIIIRPFEKSQLFNGDVLHDFFKYVHPSHKVITDSSEIKNPSLSHQKLYLIGLLRKFPHSKERDAAIGNILRMPEAEIEIISSRFAKLDRDERKSIVKIFKNVYEKIEKRFLNNKKLFIEDLDDN